MRPILPLTIALLLAASSATWAEEQPTRLCTAHFVAGDRLPLERRFVGMLAGEGCTAGDLLHFVFAAEGLAAAVAARHCRFDRPVLLDRGAETHLVCVWQGMMRRPRP
jgi:hypothetical protein